MSQKETILVCTGNSLTGLSTLQHLLEKQAGERFNVRACIRKKSNNEDLEDLPIEVITGDIKQKSLLGPVFENVSRAYFAIPTTQDRADIAKHFIDACMNHGVEHAVILSVVGADTGATTFHKHFKEIEEYALSKAGQPVTLKVGDKGQVKFKPQILRCAMFYQNMFSFVPVLKEGHLYLPLRAGSLGHVDMEDVGECIAELLINPEGHEQKQIFNLIGEYQRGNMVATAFSMGAKTHCQYENVEPEVIKQTYEALKIQPWLCDALTDLFVWFQTEESQGIESDLPSLLGRNPTKFSAFVARELKPVLDDATID